MSHDYHYTGYQSCQKEKARILRKDMTRQEKHLWYDFLCNYPIKIYRQRVIDYYIADFYCSSARLVIELDGSQHYTESGKNYDEARTKIMQCYHLKVIRFRNYDIDNNFIGVCQYIDNEIRQRMLQLQNSHTSSPLG